MNFKEFFYLLFRVSWLKTFVLNARMFGLKKCFALPVLIGRGVMLKNIGRHSSIVIDSKTSYFGMIKLGISDGSFHMGASKKSNLSLGTNSKLVFNGSCNITKGFFINVFDDAVLSFGNNTSFNPFLVVKCEDSISIGQDCIFGWNVTIMDCDGHTIFLCENEEPENKKSQIVIKQKCWIASNTTILKGTYISDDSVVATGAIVTKKIFESNVILAGNPAKIIKRNVFWKM